MGQNTPSPSHVTPTTSTVAAPAVATMPAGHPRRRRKRRLAEQSAELRDTWLLSPEGRTAHARALEEVGVGRVQDYDHAAFVAAFGANSGETPRIAWSTTDEFARRHDRLRGRSHRAFAAALDAFVSDVHAGALRQGRPRFRASLEVHRVEDLGDDCWSLSWSNEGRATFLLRRGGAGATPEVVWLVIGPHGSPDRKRARRPR